MNLVVAIGSNNEIGKDNKLIWKQSEDLKFFKKITTNNVVIMGRNTFESIGKPLPNRLNIVLTSNSEKFKKLYFDFSNLIFIEKINEIIKVTKNYDDNNLFVIGGAQIYNEFLKTDLINKIYLTKIITPILKNNDDYVLFPNIGDDWKLINESELFREDEKNQYPYKFIEYVRKNN